ncbi:MAG: hypothetical protein M3R24_31600 [Chloroflexota bacterium]|nr:hypothetical protein [Chloroflexota bacterium]
MGTRTWDGWRRWLLISLLGSAVTVPVTTAQAQATPVPAQLTILVRDANGTALAGVWLSVYAPQPPAAPRTVASGPTGADGRLTLTRLIPGTTYVVQFDSAAQIIVAGKHIGSRPIQFQDDQNAGREVVTPDDVPGFPIHLGDERHATVRFVVGGTFSAGELAAAVPMIDLAASDDAPVRPVNPLTGAELTPEEARTFHAVIGQPWGVAHGSAISVTDSQTRDADQPLPGTAADVEGDRPVSPAATPRLLIGGLLTTIGVLVAAVAMLLVRQRGQAR